MCTPSEHNSIHCGCSQRCSAFALLLSTFITPFAGCVSVSLMCKSLSYCTVQKCVLSAPLQGPAIQEDLYTSDIHRYDIGQAVYSFFHADIHSRRFMAVLICMEYVKSTYVPTGGQHKGKRSPGGLWGDWCDHVHRAAVSEDNSTVGESMLEWCKVSVGNKRSGSVKIMQPSSLEEFVSRMAWNIATQDTAVISSFKQFPSNRWGRENGLCWPLVEKNMKTLLSKNG